jgi:hypothetical protein
MLTKSLSGILGQFNKVATQLEEFIDSNAKKAGAAAIKISMLEDDNKRRLGDSEQARKSLEKIKELIGE